MKGVKYSAGRKGGPGGANRLAVLGSVEAQTVADGIEGGLGLTQTMRLVNTETVKCFSEMHFWISFNTKKKRL